MKDHKPHKLMRQYTLRRIPLQTDALLREKAAAYGMSLNEAALHALKEGLGQRDGPLHHDFDAYAKTWVNDESMDQVLKEFEAVDETMWQ